MANVINVRIEGQALETFGFTANQTISGVGLNTFGFLWAAEDIWTDCDGSITTTWTDCTDCTGGCDT